jgi:uncharacterized protein
MRIVIDTNTLLIAIPKKSKYRPVFDAILSGKVELAIVNDIVLEYHEKLAEKASPTVADNVVKLLLSLDNVILKSAYFEWNLITQDPDDNKFVDCYVVSEADYLISDDKHYNILRDVGFPPIKVLKSDEFLRVL